MSRHHDLEGWPECLQDKTLDELERLLEAFRVRLRIPVRPLLKKLCLKDIRRIENEIARRENSPDK